MLRDVYRSAGVPDAAASIDGLMRFFAVASRRPPALGCPACTRLTDDEAQILNGVRALQRDEGLGAEVILAAWLPARAAELAAPAMEGLARLLLLGGFDLASDRAPALAPPQRLH
jgi:AcrR family transcriptional regulator